MNTLIVWFDGEKVTLYQVPNSVLKHHDPDGFIRCNGKMVNRNADDNTGDYITYLARLIGIQTHYGPLPDLSEWVAGQALSVDQSLVRQTGLKYVPPFAQFKVEVSSLLNCETVINTGWVV